MIPSILSDIQSYFSQINVSEEDDTPQPTPPQSPYEWGTVEDYLAELQLWLNTNAASFSTYQLQTIKAELQTLRNEALYCSDQKKLATIVSSGQKVINPPPLSPDQDTADTWLVNTQERVVAFSNLGNLLTSEITSFPQELEKDNTGITSAQNHLGSVTSPATRSQLAQELNLARSNLDAEKSSISSLNETAPANIKATVAQKKSLEAQVAECRTQIYSHPNDHTENQPLIDKMIALCKKIPPPGSGALSGFVHPVNAVKTVFTTAESSLINVRRQIPGYAPPALPSGQMYLDMNYIAVVFQKNPNPANALTSYFSTLKASGIDRIDLSFSQLTDVSVLGTSGTHSANDTVGMWIQANTAPFTQLASIANKCGMKLDISFGGQNATTAPTSNPKTGKTVPPDWQLPAGVDPKISANALVTFMKNHNIDSVDIDIEGDISTADTPARYVEFFTTLHTLLKPMGKKVYLTTLASVTDWPERYIHFLFYGANDTFIFPEMFDGINLMAYSATEYYLDPTNPSWGFESWLKIFGKENAHMINVGFEDNVNYINGTTPISATNNGDAAAMRYINLLEALETNVGVGHLGETFVWPDYGLNPPDYQHGTLPSTRFESDFFNPYNRWNALFGASAKV